MVLIFIFIYFEWRDTENQQYCFVAETLGQAIRHDQTIQGIQIPGANNNQSKVLKYADDTTLILANEYSITQSFNLINAFERGSASHLKAQKTEDLLIGSAASKQTGPVNITWTTDNLKILGVYFGTSNVEHANWIDRVAKLEKQINLWKSHSLSLKGKSQIINSIGASGLWYTATVLPMHTGIHSSRGSNSRNEEKIARKIKKKRKASTQGTPRWSPIQVLIPPDRA